MAMLKGVKRLYISVVTKDDETGVACDTPIFIPGLNKIDVKPKINQDSFDADDKVYESVYAYGDTDVELIVADLPQAIYAMLMGHTTTGAEMIRNAKDAVAAPYVCIGYERTTSGTNSRYKWLYKGRFMPGDESNESAGKAVKLKPTTIKATFEGFNYNGDFDRTLDTASPNYVTGEESTFFDNPIKNYSDVAPTVSCSIADAATGVSVGTNIIFTFDKAIQAATANNDNVMVMGADGSAVTGALSMSADNKVVTFNPTADLTALTDYIAVVSTGVKDLSGNKLVAAKVTNFRTA